MYAGAVAVPLIVGRALKLNARAGRAADLGRPVLLRPRHADPVARLRPLVRHPAAGDDGRDLRAVGPMVAMANAMPGVDGARAIFGAIIGAGIISILIAPFVSRLLRFFPPVVTGTIIAIIGISLMRVGIGWAMGGPPNLAQSVDVPKLVAMVDGAKATAAAASASGAAAAPLPPRPGADARQRRLRRPRQHGDRRVRAGRHPAHRRATRAASSPTSRCCSASSPAACSPSAWARWRSTRSARRTGSTSSRRSPSARRPSIP